MHAHKNAVFEDTNHPAAGITGTVKASEMKCIAFSKTPTPKMHITP
jgi:RNase P/RNase MRP subunit p29